MQFSQESRRKVLPYVLILPVILYYSVFWLYPVIRCFILSFQDPQGNFSFQNYAFIFSNEDFYRACFNTAFIVVFSVALEFGIAFGLALLINKKFKGSSFFPVYRNDSDGASPRLQWGLYGRAGWRHMVG